MATKEGVILSQCKVFDMTKIRQLLDIELTERQILKQDEMEAEKLQTKLNRWLVTNYVGAPSQNAKPRKLNVVLLGKTGVGKSTTGNLLLGRDCFITSERGESCTKTIQSASCTIDGIQVNIIDTPGVMDTNTPAKQITTEIAKVMECFSDGIDGFVFVYNWSDYRFTEQEQQAFRTMSDHVFGQRSIDHCYVILTHANGERSLTKYLEDEYRAGTEFGELLKEKLDSRVIAVDNSDQNPYMRAEMRTQIVRMIVKGPSGRYTNEDFRKYAEQKWQLREQYPETRHLSETMEQMTFKELESVPYSELVDMEHHRKGVIVQAVLQKVLQMDGVDPVLKMKIEEQLWKTLDMKIQRLIDERWWQSAKMTLGQVGVMLAAGAGLCLLASTGLFGVKLVADVCLGVGLLVPGPNLLAGGGIAAASAGGIVRGAEKTKEMYNYLEDTKPTNQ